MHEWLFPIAALLLTWLVLVPIATVVATMWLRARRRTAASWLEVGSTATWLGVVLPVVIPFLWLFSAAIHENERVRRGAACLFDHVHADQCGDAMTLMAIWMLLIGGVAAWRWWRDTRNTTHDCRLATRTQRQRVARLVQHNRWLQNVRLRVVHHAAASMYTRGIVFPVVVIDACFAEDVDDSTLLSSILHERAHIQHCDVLRALIARTCLSVNPCAFLLRPEYHHWRSSREARCDQEAIRMGGDRLALAQGILRAARIHCHQPLDGCMALCGHELKGLQLRIALLLHEEAPALRQAHLETLLLTLLAATSVMLPHVTPFDLLGVFHTTIETWFHLIF